MIKIPISYIKAAKLSHEAETCLNFAWLVWSGLSKTMQATLVDNCYFTPPARVQTVAALEARGLIQDAWHGCGYELTPLGLLVREAGTKRRDYP